MEGYTEDCKDVAWMRVTHQQRDGRSAEQMQQRIQRHGPVLDVV